MIDAFLSGFIRYDFIIFGALIVNLVIYYRTKRLVGTIETTLYPRSDTVSAREDEVIGHTLPTKQTVDDLKDTLKKANRSYTLFVNFISIFPLLGILGTVWALLGVAVGDGLEASEDNFLMALTSTAWGVIFSMVFKVGFDPRISPDIEKFNREVENVELERKKIR